MTKKDFELIARVVNRTYRENAIEGAILARRFEAALRETNPRFDGPRFYLACTKLED